MKRLIALATLSLVTLSWAGFTKVGTAGAQFLKIGVEPRGIALAGAYSTLCADASALYWNPAGMARAEKQDLLVSDVEWFAGIRTNYLGYVLPRGAVGTFGIGVTALTFGTEALTSLSDPDATENRTWSASCMAFTLGYARQFIPEFSFGANVKYVQETIFETAANGLAFDFGTYLDPKIFGTLKAAFVVSNFGQDLSFHGENLKDKVFRQGWPGGIAPIDIELTTQPYPLPLSMRLGLSYEFDLKSLGALLVAAELSHPNDGSEKVQAGVEYNLKNVLFLRAGYRYDPDQEAVEGNSLRGLAFGGGVRTRLGGQTYSVGYAGEDWGRLGLRHRFSLGVSF